MQAMPQLQTKPTLSDFQEYVRQLERERGFTENTVLQNSLMLGEEIGELFKAIRKAEKMRIDGNSQVGNVEEEMADVLIYLCSIANRYNIDLEKAFRDKEEINKARTWTS
jgi:NTP pyrophosphatase (non-canonical NTP hydrolase)